jgi:hypothetical protein
LIHAAGKTDNSVFEISRIKLIKIQYRKSLIMIYEKVGGLLKSRTAISWLSVVAVLALTVSFLASRSRTP